MLPLLLLVIVVMTSTDHPVIMWSGFAVVLLLQIGIVVYGCINIQSGYFVQALCKGKTEEKIVALTFDDGPNATYSGSILDTLKQYRVPAAFFVIGRNIEGNEAILKRMDAEGHIIGNHSFSHHFWFDMYSTKKMIADLHQADAEIKKVTGKLVRLFRPPYGVTNPNVKSAIKRTGYIPVGWSVRSMDTAAKDKTQLLAKINNQLEPGAIILLHDSMEITAAVLPELIESIQAKGYKITGLDELLNIRAYA